MSRTREILSLFVIVAAMLLPCARAGAQGTSGSLPGPIDSRQLGRYAERLGLSDSQRLAMEGAHDDYRRRFRLLRDGAIAAFLKDSLAMQGGIPERARVVELLEEMEDIHAKIALLDNSLFSQLVPLLSDQQQAIVPRLRMARERKRYEVQQTQASFGRRTVDLSELFLDLDLEPATYATGDGILASYERRMTTIMRKQNDAFLRMTLDMMDALAEAGFTDISQEQLIADPEMTKRLIAEVAIIFADLRGQAAEHGNDLRELNERTYRQIAAIVPADQAHGFRNAYLRGAYPQLASIVAIAESDWMTAALAVESLSDEERELIEATGTGYQRRLDGVFADGVKQVDAFWASFSPVEVNAEAGETLRAGITELHGQATEAQTTADGLLEGELGSERVALIRLAMRRQAAAPPTVPDEDVAQEGDAEKAIAFSGDRFLPARISSRDIKRYTKQLQLENDMSQVLTTLHHDYLERLSTLEVLDALREARNAARAEGNDASGVTGSEKLDRVYALRRQAVEAVAAADGAFFDDLAVIIGAEKADLLDRVRQSRLRRTYGGSASDRLALGRHNSHEASVDVVSIVLEEQPTEPELQQLDEVLAEYEASAMEAFRARFDAQLEMQRMTDQWTAEITAAARDDIAAVIDLQMRYGEAMREPVARVERTDRAIVELNRQTLDRVLGAATPERAGTIRRAYDLAAFPSIYRDPAALGRHLERALELDDLTAVQRERLQELGGPYRAEYDTLSREMIEHLGTGSVNAVGLDPEIFKAWQRRQQQVARTQFDRNELNSRAISRLQSVLTETQIARIGGLPKPLGEDDFFFYR